MSRTTTLASSPAPSPAGPATVSIRPSDRLTDDLPRHGTRGIPSRPRREVIVIETAAEPAIRVTDAGQDDDRDALEYSAELL